MSVRRVINGKLPVRRVINGKLPVRRVVTSKLPVRRFITGKLPVRRVITGKLPGMCLNWQFINTPVLLTRVSGEATSVIFSSVTSLNAEFRS